MTAGVAAALELAVDFAYGSDRTAGPGGVFTETSGFDVLDGVAAFFFDPLLSVDWVGFDGFLAAIRFSNHLHDVTETWESVDLDMNPSRAGRAPRRQFRRQHNHARLSNYLDIILILRTA